MCSAAINSKNIESFLSEAMSQLITNKAPPPMLESAVAISKSGTSM